MAAGIDTIGDIERRITDALGGGTTAELPQECCERCWSRAETSACDYGSVRRAGGGQIPSSRSRADVRRRHCCGLETSHLASNARAPAANVALPSQLQRRGRDSNPRWTVRPTTVFREKGSFAGVFALGAGLRALETGCAARCAALSLVFLPLIRPFIGTTERVIDSPVGCVAAIDPGGALLPQT